MGTIYKADCLSVSQIYLIMSIVIDVVPYSRIQFFNINYLGNTMKESNVHPYPFLVDGIDLL
ncbi:hypothetical protein BpHYR1_012316 [Brachionus plicatilis]|uniref:Uncharacterized protein n=1 Tax=Brachionus plicatilis TaxID=10195 RepID=A0A3M7R6R6_BRAPC|nr:hypothetical protein BpHYR1_012316 [Brachionus plicatilis]